MQTQPVESAVKKNWILDKWYEKTIYVFGFIYTAMLIFAFAFGFMQAIME